MITLQKITEALQASWSGETSVWADELPEDNQARGQCVVSSLIVQDYFGGDLVRVHATGEGIDENHYYNRLDDGTLIDTTGQQYKTPVVLSPNPVDLKKGGYGSMRERCLADDDTSRRYETLKQAVERQIAGAESS